MTNKINRSCDEIFKACTDTHTHTDQCIDSSVLRLKTWLEGHVCWTHWRWRTQSHSLLLFLIAYLKQGSHGNKTWNIIFQLSSRNLPGLDISITPVHFLAVLKLQHFKHSCELNRKTCKPQWLLVCDCSINLLNQFKSFEPFKNLYLVIMNIYWSKNVGTLLKWIKWFAIKHYFHTHTCTAHLLWQCCIHAFGNVASTHHLLCFTHWGNYYKWIPYSCENGM